MRRGSSRSLAALLLAIALSGCASAELFDSNEHWFSKPFEVVSRKGGYTYSELQEAQTTRVITANDLVDANGACPQQAAPPPASPENPAGSPAPASAVFGEGIALGMSECDVVNRAGAPSAVQLGNNPNGDRTATLSFNGGPRPGIYHFERGRLVDMDRVDVPAPAEKAKVAKKKPKRRQPQPQQVSTE